MHSWEFVQSNPALKWRDFVAHPELIRQALEDFKLWERYEAVDKFYDQLSQRPPVSTDRRETARFGEGRIYGFGNS